MDILSYFVHNCNPIFSGRELSLETAPFPVKLVLIPAALCDDLLRNILGDLNIAVRLHGVLAAALSGRPQVGGVAEHIGQRHQSVHLSGAGAVLLTLNLSAAAVQVADYVT